MGTFDHPLAYQLMTAGGGNYSASTIGSIDPFLDHLGGWVVEKMC